jgi:hypothetical protein
MKMTPQVRRGLIIGFSFIVIVLVLNLIGKYTDNPNRTYIAGIGQDAMLDAGDKLVPVAIDEKAFDEYIKASVANDQRGRVNLLSSGDVFGVEKGTKVRIIDEASLRRKVRILSGEKEGLAGWVAIDYLRKIPQNN